MTTQELISAGCETVGTRGLESALGPLWVGCGPS